MYEIHQLINRIDEGGRISSALPLRLARHYHMPDNVHKNAAEHAAEWIFVVSTALSFQSVEEGPDDELIDDELFGGEFELTDGIVQAFLLAMEHVFNQTSPEVIQTECLKTEVDQLRWSWSERRNFLERHMLFLSKLAGKVMHYVDWDVNGEYMAFTEFEIKVLKKLKNTLVTTAYDILNMADYKFDRVFKLDSLNMSILYLLFGVFPHSISVARSDPINFEKSLYYRSYFDIDVFDCLFEYKDIHDKLLPRDIKYHRYAIDDMLVQLPPSALTHILIRVYPWPNHYGSTFLHELADVNRFAFAQIFPHCEVFWFSRDCEGLTPMARLFLNLPHRDGDDDPFIMPPKYTKYEGDVEQIDLLFDIVSCNSNFFALLALK